MVEARLESLVQRLEAAVAKQESLAGGAGATGGAARGGSGTGGCALAKQYATAVTPLIADLRAKTTDLGNQYVTDITNTWLSLVHMQGQTLTTMSRFSKPADTQFLFAGIKEAFDAGEKVKRDRKSPINHVSVVMDSYQLMQYPAFEEVKALVDTIGEFYDMLPFNGNKILKADVAKDVAWYQAHMALCAAIKEFILENCTKINTWYGSEDGSGAAAYFASATTADKCNDFSSLEGSAGGAAPSAPAKSAGAPASSAAVASEYTAATKPHLDSLKAAAVAIENGSVTQATDFYCEAASINAALLNTMASFRKPTDVAFATTGSKIVTMMNTVDEAGKKDRKSPMDVMKVCNDGFQLFFWNTTPGNDLLNDYLTEIESQVLFYGNRIRKKGKDSEKAWFEAYFQFMTAHLAFVRDRRESICDWKGTQDGAGAAAFFASQSTGSAATPAAAASAAPVEEKKVAAAAKPAPAKAAAGKKPPAQPVRELRGNKWVIENFTNETIRFDDPDEVNKRVSFEFFNCNKCTIQIVGKCQNISIQSCKSTTIETDKVVSQIELFKCQAFNIRAKNQLPMAAIEGCNQTHIYLTHATLNTKISSSCTRSTIVHFPKEGMTDEQLNDDDNWHTSPVPEVFTTTVNGKKLLTEGYMEDD